MFKSITLTLTILLLSLLTPTLSQHSTPRFLQSSASDCIQNGYYDCDICPCSNFTDTPLTVSSTLSAISILFSLIIILGYIRVQDMREQPGDIVLGVAISDIIFCVALILENFKDMSDDEDEDNDEDANCLFYGSLKTFALFLVSFYHISFSVFYLVILKGSLKSQNLPWYLYHIFAFLASIALFLFYLLSGGIGRNIYGYCGTKTAPGMTFPIISYGGVVIITLVLTCFIKRYLPRNERISSLRARFLKFYLVFVIVLVISYLVNGIADAEIGDIVQAFLEEKTTFEIIRKLNLLKKIKSVIMGMNPVLLTLARLVDPMMRESWKQTFRCCCCSDRDRRDSRFQSLLDPRKVSLDLAAVQRSIEKKSHIFQFQHSRKVQAVYSLLSSIHYFWHRKEKKSERSDSLGKPVNPKYQVENELYYIKEANHKEEFPIEKDTMVGAIPELLDEIEKRNYDFDTGTFTVYAPEIFNEIIDLDETGRGIRRSLDLKENFNRILKSGINGGGRSGEFFFFSSDNKIIIKTISNTELKVLLRILPSYITHFKGNPQSLIAKIYGVFTLKVHTPDETYNLILMRNINGLPTNYVKRKYDLKGSTFGRRAIKLKDNLSMNELQFIHNMKDLDFDRFEGRVHAPPELEECLVEVLRKDTEYLASQNLIDYSLALYVVDKEAYFRHKGKYLGALNSITEVSERSSLSSLNGSQSDLDASFDPPTSLAESLLSMRSTKENLDYHFGIIDYLIDFSFRKKAELFLKKLVMCNPNLNISVQRPHVYSERFLKYMKKIFLTENDDDDNED